MRSCAVDDLFIDMVWRRPSNPPLIEAYEEKEKPTLELVTVLVFVT